MLARPSENQRRWRRIEPLAHRGVGWRDDRRRYRNLGAVGPSSELFGPTVRHTASTKTIALTFDDGPNPLSLRSFSNFRALLRTRDIFLIGRFARACPIWSGKFPRAATWWQSYRHARESDFSIAHGNSRRVRAVSSRDIRCHPFRPAALHAPPYGFRSPLLNSEVRRAGMHAVVMWSKICWIGSRSSRAFDREARARRRPGGSHGDIVVLHEAIIALSAATASRCRCARTLLPRWRDAGLEFVTIDLAAVSDSARRRAYKFRRAPSRPAPAPSMAARREQRHHGRTPVLYRTTGTKSITSHVRLAARKTITDSMDCPNEEERAARGAAKRTRSDSRSRVLHGSCR